MKKITFLFLLIFAVSINAQDFSFGVVGGFTTIQSPESYTAGMQNGGLGLGTNFHFGLKLRDRITKGPVALTWQFIYTQLTNNENNIEVELNLYTLGMGVEWNLIKEPGVTSPYLAFDLFYCQIGELTIRSGNLYVSGEGEGRLGAGFGPGVIIPISNEADFDINAKYNFNNLIGKEGNENAVGTTVISVAFLYHL